MHSKVVRKFFVVLLCLLTGFVLASCGGGGGSDSGGGTGTLSTSLTDSSTEEYKAVYVTIARVDVHLGGDEDVAGNWQTVATPNKTYNLLELVNGVRETLGLATMDAGIYSQMRLIIGLVHDGGINILSRQHEFANYVIDKDDDEIHELKVPSGTQTGLKVVNGFEIYTDQTTELILDFDASRSVVKAGNSGNYLLKPTVKVLTTEEYAIVSGTVTDLPPVTTPPTDPALLPGTLITAQTAAPLATDAKDQVVIEAGTIADESGDYTLFLKPTSYNIVATKEGYLPECTAVTPVAGKNTSGIDFSLEAVTPLITVNMNVTGLSDDQYATIDFRQSATCVDALGPAMITVKSSNLANGNYSFELPAGIYQVVASSYGEETVSLQDVNIDISPETVEVTFP